MTADQKAKDKKRKAAYKAKHKERIKARKRADYLKNKQKYLTIERDRQYKKRYGITLDDYNEMLEAQDKSCAICGATKAGNKNQAFAVDHCHETGRVRGLLCISCNVKLGMLPWVEKYKAIICKYLKG